MVSTTMEIISISIDGLRLLLKSHQWTIKSLHYFCTKWIFCGRITPQQSSLRFRYGPAEHDQSAMQANDTAFWRACRHYNAFNWFSSIFIKVSNVWNYQHTTMIRPKLACLYATQNIFVIAFLLQACVPPGASPSQLLQLLATIVEVGDEDHNKNCVTGKCL